MSCNKLKYSFIILCQQLTNITMLLLIKKFAKTLSIQYNNIPTYSKYYTYDNTDITIKNNPFN